MHFLYKAMLQNIFSYMPFGSAINEQFRKKKAFDRVPFSTIFQCITQISLLESEGCTIEGKTILELGPGWKPIFSLVYKFLGAEKMIMVDLNKLLTKKYFFSALDDLSFYQPQIQDELKNKGLSSIKYEKNFKTLLSSISQRDQFNEILKKAGLEYLAPYDARHLNISDSGIDIYFSRTVLEHIDGKQISQIYHEVHRVLKPDGHMIHLIDIDDHWSYFDRSINGLNFLRYNDRVWKLINSPIAFQNRLRARQHCELIEDANFVVEKFIPNHSSLPLDEIETFRKIINSQFRQFSNEELSISSFYVMAKPC
jgi:SAM-dependent methyltransferase